MHWIGVIALNPALISSFKLATSLHDKKNYIIDCIHRWCIVSNTWSVYYSIIKIKNKKNLMKLSLFVFLNKDLEKSLTARMLSPRGEERTTASFLARMMFNNSPDFDKKR